MAVAALEENFFRNLIRGLGLAPEDVPSHMDPRYRPSVHWFRKDITSHRVPYWSILVLAPCIADNGPR
jgi:hypothetical protein